jgi:DNA repair exonuclease SbcCD nuclease subunit
MSSLALKEPEAADLIANATRQSFVNTINACINEQVDALLISGDLYDGELSSMKTAQFFTRQMQHLADNGIDVFMVRGNHDAESKITKHLVLPDNVHVFSARGEMVTIEAKDVCVHGVSFAKPRAPDSLLPKFGPPAGGKLNIGMLHTSLAGSPEHDTYAPCSAKDLLEQGYHYWALGHIHKRQVHSSEPRAIVMPGIPQGRHINEAGPKSVTSVQLSHDGSISIQERSTALVEFSRVSIDLTGIEEWKSAVRKIEAELGPVFDDISAQHLVVRLALVGESTLAEKFRRDTDVLIEDTREAARRAGSVFIEQIDNKVVRAVTKSGTVALSPLEELRKLMANRVVDDSLLLQDARELLLDLQKKLPPILRDRFEPGNDDALIREFFSEGALDVLARLPDDREDRE